jgi:L-aminopeptidase/D-esterase-like protein
MQTYMCMLFDGANHVRSIEQIRAPGDAAATAEAARLRSAKTRTIGFELWKEGHKIASSFAAVMQ